MDIIFNVKYYYNVLLTSIGENKEREWSHDCLSIAMNVMFTQISAKKWTKLLKERSVLYIVKDYTQLDYMIFLVPENPDVLTPKQNLKSLRSINLFKDKQCSKIKGLTWAGGSTQRG